MKFLLFIGLCVLFLAPAAHAAGEATLILGPSSGTFYVGSTFDVSILLDTKNVSINTAEIELSFPADKLQLASPSVGQSIIQLWPAPPVFSNREGKIYFLGGIPAPGVVTSRGVVLTLTFRVVAPGSAEIRFGDRTKILANDGRGTNVLGQSPPAFYRFTVPPPEGPVVSSPTHPDQEKWYRDSNPVFVWPKGPFSDAYSYSLDDNPSGFPDTLPEGERTTSSFESAGPGILYFHIRERASGTWGGVSHYAVKIDDEPPASFKINISPSAKTSNRNPIMRFFTTDALSGFDHFELKLIELTGETASDALFFEVSSPYQFPKLEPGKYQVIVRALDRAGNTRDENVTLTIVGIAGNIIAEDGIHLGPLFLGWGWVIPGALFLFLILCVALFRAWRIHENHRKQLLQAQLH